MNTKTLNKKKANRKLEPPKISEISFVGGIKEKDFEVIAYKRKFNPIGIWTKMPNGDFEFNKMGHGLSDNRWEKYNPHAVKRISDSTVFTVGDLIKNPWHGVTYKTNEHKYIGKLEHIAIVDNQVQLITDGPFWSRSILLKNAKK